MPKRDKVIGESRRLQKEKLFALYSSPHIIRVLKLRRTKWTGMQKVLGRERCIKGFSEDI